MQVISNVTMYKCDHCGKKQQRAHSMKRHEQFCTKNQNNWHKCLQGCKYLYVDKIHMGADPNEGYGPTLKTFHCNKLDKDLYTFKAEKMKLLEKYPSDFDYLERMPLECESYETEHYQSEFLNEFPI